MTLKSWVIFLRKTMQTYNYTNSPKWRENSKSEMETLQLIPQKYKDHDSIMNNYM